MIPKVVLIGIGNFGRNHLRVLDILDKEGKIKFEGIVDNDKKRLESSGKEFNVKTSNHYKSFLKTADAFDVVSPASTHYKIVKDLLMQNKHVFVEKPLALKYIQANNLVKLANKKKKILQVGHIFRYNESISILKKIVQQKNNYPYYVTGSFLQTTKPKSDLGAIFNYLHHFDIIDNLFYSKPKKIFANANLIAIKPTRETNVTIFLELPKKLFVTLNLGWISSGKYRTLELFSKKNHIICDLYKQEIDVYQHGKLKKHYSPKHEEPLLLELLDFSTCIKTKKSPRANGSVGSRVVKIAEEATKSLRSGKVLTSPNE